MAEDVGKEPMLELFIFETGQLIDQLEQLVLAGEKTNGLENSIDEIFRVMHTIKGSAAMMLFNNIAALAHSIEDVFYFLRQNISQSIDNSRLCDIVLEGIDFIKTEVAKIESGNRSDGDASGLIEVIKIFLSELKGVPQVINIESLNADQKYYVSSYQGENKLESKSRYRAIIFFEENCEMESLRAFTVVHHLKEIAQNIQYSPPDIIENDQCCEIIRQNGFEISFNSELPYEAVRALLEETVFLKELKLEIDNMSESSSKSPKKKEIILDEPLETKSEKPMNPVTLQENNNPNLVKQNFISVNVVKMDKLMDLVGELVISEAMVTQNPELKAIGLPLDNFKKSARQLRKIVNELQDIVMAVRMVPLTATFQKMTRIVRDMCKKLGKDVLLEVLGAETEVDKNIIEHISDPLMHLIRNSIDHGIEQEYERLAKGKPSKGKIILEAKNAGGDVWIIVKDDGKGLDRDKILKKALENGLTTKSETELTDKEIYSFILLPGFSTKDSVTEFSGRGVGMDVVTKNIESIGGSVLVDSIPGEGTTISIKIPLTLAIIDGMIIRVGNSTYTIPTIAIKESFRVKAESVFKDTDDNEMMMVRGECYPIIRLHRLFKVETVVSEIEKGIITMVESETGSICLFSDALIGEQQVVVKTLPKYIKKTQGITGCTLLGDGSISLILDIAGLVDRAG